MNAKEHANLLSIFSWIYAGVQGIFVALFVLIVLLYGGMGIAMAFTAKHSDLGGLVVFGVMVLLFGFIAVFGLICMIANIRMGKQLRGMTPPTQRSMLFTGILNCVSWFCGGIMLMPFGIALGAYGIWFGVSEKGNAFLEGREPQPPYPALYPQGQMYPEQWRQP